MPKIQLKNIAFALLVVVLYFGVWRQIRVFINQKMLAPVAQTIVDTKEEFTLLNRGPNTPGLTFYQKRAEGRPIEIHFKLSGGMFLLFSMTALVFVGRLKPFAYYLFGLHLIFMVLCILSLFLGLSAFPPALYFSDILSNYLEPGLSMMVVLWGIFGNKPLS